MMGMMGSESGVPALPAHNSDPSGESISHASSAGAQRARVTHSSLQQHW